MFKIKAYRDWIEVIVYVITAEGVVRVSAMMTDEDFRCWLYCHSIEELLRCIRLSTAV